MNYGWIKLHRELMDKPLWESSTPEQKVILVTLLMMANHAEKEWEFGGERYKAGPGQFVTSLDSIVKKSGNGISIRNVRTALQRFEKYDFLTSQPTNRNRLITIVNWGLYQQNGEEPTSQLTSIRQATDKQLTTNKNVENDKNEKKRDTIPNNEPAKIKFSELVSLTQDEYDRLIKEFTEPVIISKIEDLDNYMGSKGKKYKDHNRTIRSWLKRDGHKQGGQATHIPTARPKPFVLDLGED